jgi:uncharacterized protein YukE
MNDEFARGIEIQLTILNQKMNELNRILREIASKMG